MAKLTAYRFSSVQLENALRSVKLFFSYFPLSTDVKQKYNAQLRGEARNDQVSAWHFNTKTNAYQKCHACWIPLELFVMAKLTAYRFSSVQLENALRSVKLCSYALLKRTPTYLAFAPKLSQTKNSLAEDFFSKIGTPNSSNSFRVSESIKILPWWS